MRLARTGRLCCRRFKALAKLTASKVFPASKYWKWWPESQWQSEKRLQIQEGRQGRQGEEGPLKSISIDTQKRCAGSGAPFFCAGNWEIDFVRKLWIITLMRKQIQAILAWRNRFIPQAISFITFVILVLQGRDWVLEITGMNVWWLLLAAFTGLVFVRSLWYDYHLERVEKLIEFRYNTILTNLYERDKVQIESYDAKLQGLREQIGGLEGRVNDIETERRDEAAKGNVT